MSEDFGTVNLRRGDRGRELEALRQHYRRHRDSLAGLIDDAPTEHLAADYLRLIEQIDRALLKLSELETPAVPHPARGVVTERIERASGSAAAPAPPPPLQETFGEHPLVGAPGVEPGDDSGESRIASVSNTRVALILLAGFVGLLLIGWLIWKASSDRVVPIVEQPAAIETVDTAAVPDTVAQPAVASLGVNPPANDYGVIRKGTRATRQFEITNLTEEPVTIQLSRSACRCLYYEHAEVVPPKGKEAVTVTIDAAKVKAGPLKESIKVTAKGQPAIATTFDVNATVQ